MRDFPSSAAAGGREGGLASYQKGEVLKSGRGAGGTSERKAAGARKWSDEFCSVFSTEHRRLMACVSKETPSHPVDQEGSRFAESQAMARSQMMAKLIMAKYGMRMRLGPKWKCKTSYPYRVKSG